MSVTFKFCQIGVYCILNALIACGRMMETHY